VRFSLLPSDCLRLYVKLAKYVLVTALLAPLPEIYEAECRRISSWDRTGGNRDFIVVEPGKTYTLGEIDGPGLIKRVYFTLFSPDRMWPRQFILRMYWDGEKKPSVEVPLGDFFGIMNCQIVYYASALLQVAPGADTFITAGMTSFIPMPFSESARIELVSETPREIPLWYHVDYELRDIPDNWGRFHAQWRRENPTRAVPRPQEGELKNDTGEENYVILEAEGRGRLLGFILGIYNIKGGWYGEGDDMIFIDGEQWPPSIHGTGTEEVFGGGPSPAKPYFGPYMGFIQAGGRNYQGYNAMYRFYIADPVVFRRSIRVTIEHGHANDLSNDYTSVAYWYQEEPHALFPEMPRLEERLPRMPEDLREAYELEREVLEKLFFDPKIPWPTRERLKQEARRAAEYIVSGKYREATLTLSNVKWELASL